MTERWFGASHTRRTCQPSIRHGLDLRACRPTVNRPPAASRTRRLGKLMPINFDSGIPVTGSWHRQSVRAACVADRRKHRCASSVLLIKGTFALQKSSE
jgi:hypothetical protein